MLQDLWNAFDFKQGFSTGGNFDLPDSLQGQCLEIFLVVTISVYISAIGFLRVEARDAAKCTTTHKTAPHKIYIYYIHPQMSVNALVGKL